jgi:hypothetical protein
MRAHSRGVGALQIFRYVSLWSVTMLAATGCDRQAVAGAPASNAVVRTTPAAGAMAPGDAAPSPHTHAATCAHADGAAIERPVTNFASALGDLAMYQQGPRELWRLTASQLSNVVCAAILDENASLSLLTDALALQCQSDDDNRALTNAYRPYLEYILWKFWHECAYPSVKYDAAATLLLEYVNTLNIGNSKGNYKKLDAEIDLADTLSDDQMRGIRLTQVRSIDEYRLYGAALIGDEKLYSEESDRIRKKWQSVERREQIEMAVAELTALNYAGVSQRLRDKYLPSVLSRLSDASIRSIRKDNILLDYVRDLKKQYKVK